MTIDLSRRKAIQLGAGTLAALAAGTGAAHAFTKEEMLVAGPLGDKALGDPNAPVYMIEYASLTCPHCANFHMNTMPKVKSDYIDTGKVYFIYRDFPLDGRAFGAAMLAHCAPEDAYFGMLDLFFEQQAKWAYAPKETVDQVMQDLVKQAGITQEKFLACLQNKEVLDGVQWVRTRGKDRFGITSTPSVFINGELSKAFDFDDVAKEIDAAS